MHVKKNSKIVSIALLISLTLLLTACEIPNPFKKAPLSTEPETETLTITEAPELTSTESLKGKITDLFTLDKDLECNLVGNETYSGKIYVSGKNLRGDIDVSIDPNDNTKTVESHMISDSEWFYMWSAVLPTGVKMSAQNVESTINNPDTDVLKGDMEYECRPWTVDSSKFEVPDDIKFVDVTETMKNFRGAGCSACDLIGDATAKDQCKARLGC